jgi:hypothetical protein
MPKGEFKEEVLKVISEDERFAIRVVKWGNGAPMLAKQQVYEDEDGKKRHGKVKGFNADDLEVLKENLEEIEKLLGSPTE